MPWDTSFPRQLHFGRGHKEYEFLMLYSSVHKTPDVSEMIFLLPSDVDQMPRGGEHVVSVKGREIKP